MIKIPKPIWFIASGIVIVIVLYLMFNKQLPRDFLPEGNFVQKENSENVVQIKGQLFKKGVPVEGCKVKIMDNSDSDASTFKEGKFEFKGIPYNSIQQLIHIQAKCPDCSQYFEIDRIDLANESKFPVSKGWIDLGIVDCRDHECSKKTSGGSTEVNEQERFKSDEITSMPTKKNDSESGKATKSKPRTIKDDIYEKFDEDLGYFSEVNVGFKIERATQNGKTISVEKGSASPFIKKGDILIFFGEGKEKKIQID